MDPDLAEDVAFSLNVNKKLNRGNIEIDSRDGELVFVIDTPDLTAMRAALNTHLRLLSMILNTWEVVENGKSR